MSRDGAPGFDRAALEAAFGRSSNPELRYREWPAETHATVYHPAALQALRAMLAPPTGQ